MPELPEAETIVRDLRPALTGRVLEGVEVVHDDVLRTPPDALREAVKETRISDVARRGKNVVVILTEGLRLVVNLGMTGRLLLVERGSAPPDDATHPALRFPLDDGGTLLYDDTRRFGAVELLAPEAWRDRSAELGPEPLSEAFTATRLHEALSRSRSPVRSWLLDQRKLAGVGNIYANEALHHARVHPRRPARTLGAEEAGRLHGSLRRVLREAIRARGTTLRDYRDASGERGEFAVRLSVYGREGLPCTRCDTPVEREVFGNRSAFFCPSCQPVRR